MNLGVQLRVYRKSKGHSVQKVSELTGISADKIYKWEKGTRPSDAEDLLKIRAYMGGNIEAPPKNEDGKLENGQTRLSGTFTMQDYKDSIEKRIAEIEARRLEAVARAEEIKAMYQGVQQEKGVLYEIIKENLTQLLTNSKSTIAYLQTILRVNRADDAVIMDNQDVQAGREVGSSAMQAGSLEIAAAKDQLNRDKKQKDGVRK